MSLLGCSISRRSVLPSTVTVIPDACWASEDLSRKAGSKSMARTSAGAAWWRVEWVNCMGHIIAENGGVGP
ncbi:hypothetical protein GCM10009668_02510 [Nocardioides dubius]|uniref:Uncharacterized protein n=1 Tax=Nocardioides dubius TaxID=317019 RepID=A0ABN1TK51_9ACTN